MGWGSWVSFVSTNTYSHNSMSIPKNQVRTWSKVSRHLEGGCQSPTPRKTLQEPLHLGLHSEKERRLFISTPIVEIWSASQQDHSSKMLLTNFFQASSLGVTGGSTGPWETYWHFVTYTLPRTQSHLFPNLLMQAALIMVIKVHNSALFKYIIFMRKYESKKSSF